MEAQEILDLLGFTPTEGEDITIDQVREYYDKTFIPIADIPNRKDIIDPYVKAGIGQRLGSLQTKFVSSAKDLGIDINHADYKDKPIEDLLPTVFGSISEKLKAKPKGDSKLQEDYERISKEYTDLKNEVPKFEEQINGMKTEFQNEKSNWLKSHAENEAWKKVKFASTTNDLMKVGFESKIKSTYESIVDETGNIYPVYKAGENKGSRVKSPTKVTEHLKWDDLLLMEAQKENLLPAPHDGKATKPVANPRQQQTQPQTQQGARKVHPNFMG